MELDNYFEMNESVINFCNPNIQVKEEECNYLYVNYPVQSDFVQYQNLAECLSTLLKQDIKQVEWIIANSHFDLMRMVDKAKRIIRRERTKLRVRMQRQLVYEQPVLYSTPQYEVKQEFVAAETETVNPEKKKRGKRAPKQQYVSDTQSTSDEQNQKKMVQMIRNRISAQISRDKKKEYLQGLEQNAKYHEEQNLHLKKQLKELQQKHAQAEEENRLLRQQFGIDQYKSKKIHKNSHHYKAGNELLKVIDQYVKHGQIENINKQLEWAKSQVQNLFEINVQ